MIWVIDTTDQKKREARALKNRLAFCPVAKCWKVNVPQLIDSLEGEVDGIGWKWEFNMIMRMDGDY